MILQIIMTFKFIYTILVYKLHIFIDFFKGINVFLEMIETVKKMEIIEKK